MLFHDSIESSMNHFESKRFVIPCCQRGRVPVFVVMISSAVIPGNMCGCLLHVQVRGRPQMVFGKTDLMFLELKRSDHHQMHREKMEQLR